MQGGLVWEPTSPSSQLQQGNGGGAAGSAAPTSGRGAQVPGSHVAPHSRDDTAPADGVAVGAALDGDGDAVVGAALDGDGDAVVGAALDGDGGAVVGAALDGAGDGVVTVTPIVRCTFVVGTTTVLSSLLVYHGVPNHDGHHACAAAASSAYTSPERRMTMCELRTSTKLKSLTVVVLNRP